MPSAENELALQPGDKLQITHSIAGGNHGRRNSMTTHHLAWLDGTNLRTGEQGVFPTSFVRRRYKKSSIMLNPRAVKVRMDPSVKQYDETELQALLGTCGPIERLIGRSNTGKTAIVLFCSCLLYTSPSPRD